MSAQPPKRGPGRPRKAPLDAIAATPEVSDAAINAAAERALQEPVGTLEGGVPVPAGTTFVPPVVGDLAEPLVAPGELLELEGGWKLAQPQGQRLVRRMPGPFSVATLEGVMRCEDGWLAIDPRGNPYPIAADVFARAYVVVQDAARPDLEAIAPGLVGRVRAA